MWVIVHIGPPPLYIKSGAALSVTCQVTEADRFESEMEATKEIIRLRLPRDWLAVDVASEYRTIDKHGQ